jgi:hypothetical protein
VAGNASLPVLPIVAGGLLLLAVTSPGKKVSGIKERYQALSPGTKQLLVYGGIGVGAYFLLSHLLSYKPTVQQQAELDHAKAELQRLAAEEGVFPSFNDAQYDGMAANILQAVDDCGTGELTIYRQFSALRNEADIYKLIIAFGVGSYKGCFEGTYFGNVHRTLPEAITSDLRSYEVDQVNSILSDSNIAYRF